MTLWWPTWQSWHGKNPTRQFFFILKKTHATARERSIGRPTFESSLNLPFKLNWTLILFARLVTQKPLPGVGSSFNGWSGTTKREHLAKCLQLLHRRIHWLRCFDYRCWCSVLRPQLPGLCGSDFGNNKKSSLLGWGKEGMQLFQIAWWTSNIISALLKKKDRNE